LPVAEEVLGIAVVRDRERVERERVVEAVVARLALAGDVEATVEMPLPERYVS
jgi:hypothetical protein